MSIAFKPQSSIPDSFFRLAEEQPHVAAYSHAIITPSGRIHRFCTYKHCATRVRKLAAYLRSQGLGKGDRAAIISGSRPEWLEADLAVLSLGGVVVSVYQTLPAEAIGYILHDSDAKIVFVEEQEHLDKLQWLLQSDIDIPPVEDRPPERTRIVLRKIISFEQLGVHENLVSLDGAIAAAAEEQLPSNIIGTDLASLVYTSGTTGPPKGVMQTHANHLANVRQVLEAGIVLSGERIIVFLPLAHSFAKLMGYIGLLTAAELFFPAATPGADGTARTASIAQDMSKCGAHIFPVVPRVLDKTRERLLHAAQGLSPAAVLLRLALWSAEKRYAAHKKGTGGRSCHRAGV